MNISLADAILSAVPEEGRWYGEVLDEVSSAMMDDFDDGSWAASQGIRELCSCDVLIRENNAVYRGLRYEECVAELRDAQAVVEAFSTKYGQ